MVTRRIRRGVVTAIMTATSCGLAWADGGFFWKSGADLLEPQQRAIIHFANGSETLILQVKYEGPAEDFAWVVPLPAPPKVSAVKTDADPFAEISLFSQQRDRSFSGSRQAATPGVAVVERKVVGVYDTAVLRADDEGALGRWLAGNGYKLPETFKDIAAGYVRSKWTFVAMRIDPKALTPDAAAKLKKGQLQAICLRFPSPEMVYPLQISALNAGKTEVLLYLLAEAPMVRRQGPAHAGFIPPAVTPSVWRSRTGSSAASEAWQVDAAFTTPGRVTGKELPLTWAALNLDAATPRHLTKYRLEFSAADLTDDLTFAPFDPVSHWKARLAEAKTAYDRRAVLEILASLSRDFEAPLAQARAENRRERQAEARRLAAGAEPSARIRAARMAEAPAEVLETLAADPSPKVRQEAAGHPNLSRGALHRLLQDVEPTVRVAAACNALTPETTRAVVLARDKDTAGRAWLAGNMNDPVLARLLAGDREPAVRETLAGNARCPADVLRALAVDPDTSVRATVARNPLLPPDALASLAGDPKPPVRAQVAQNRQTPLPLLEQLATDSDANVRQAAARALRSMHLDPTAP